MEWARPEFVPRWRGTEAAGSSGLQLNRPFAHSVDGSPRRWRESLVSVFGRRICLVGQLFFFDPEVLGPIAKEYQSGYDTAVPFPHAVIDGLIPDQVLEAVIEESPGPHERDDWHEANRADAVKLSIQRDWALGPTTRQLLNQFNSATFVNFLEELTGIDGLIPDPHYLGGGLHQIERGGFLKVHADFNRHERLQLDRRINALLYLNHDWKDSWGGRLELWNRTMTECEQKIAPVFNRLVVFSTTDTSFHGHPDPLECPLGTRRRSLALYYYTNGRPESERSEPHFTLHQVRPGEDFDPYPAARALPDPPAPTDSSRPPAPPDPGHSPARASSRSPQRRQDLWREFVPPVAVKLKRRMARYRDRRR
jgi:Rps23 Pro-64 3,4-dihydroxylase Tpa1-like proline 4-hydroxylase